MITVGGRIKELRLQLGMNQTDFSEKLNLKQSTIAGYEKDFRTVLDRTVKDICRVYNISYAWLVHGEGDMFMGEDSDIKVDIDRIMAGDSEFHKAIIKSIIALDDDQIIAIEKLITDLYNRTKKKS